MAETKYDYSNKRSYNGVAPKENEASPSVNPALWTNSHKAIFKHKKKGFPAANRTQ